MFRSFRVNKLNSKLCIIAAIACLSIVCVSGCGKEETSYVQNGMNELAALNYSDALEDFESAREAGEDERLILRGQGMVYLAQLKYEEAIECFIQCLSLSDGVPEDLDYDVNYYLATAYYKNGQYDEAIKVYDAILTLKNNESIAYYLRGIVMLDQGTFDDAMTDFKKAMEINSGDYDMILDIYQAMAAHGYKDAGRDMLSSCIASDSHISDYDMGRFEYYLNNFDAAKTYLEQAQKGDTAQITLYLGRTYEALGDYNYAISLYNTYLDKEHNDPQIYNQMGLCQMKMERYSEALASFQAGMNQEDNTIMQTLKFNEIVAYEYMQEYQTAATLMNAYLKAYPDDDAAVRENEFLKSR